MANQFCLRQKVLASYPTYKKGRHKCLPFSYGRGDWTSRLSALQFNDKFCCPKGTRKTYITLLSFGELNWRTNFAFGKRFSPVTLHIKKGGINASLFHMVGVTGLEPATSCSQSRRSSQTELHPVTFQNRTQKTKNTTHNSLPY